MAEVRGITVKLGSVVKANGQYICPVDGATFDTEAELIAYMQANYPGVRIPITITWDVQQPPGGSTGWAGFLPQNPLLGPPLPAFLNIYWPWYSPTIA